MKTPDTLVNVLGILYGAFLIAAAFVSNRATESMRIDALFIKGYSEKTRPINLVVGIAVACYGAWSLLAG
ncbi:MAG: hypothetical protein H3C26_20100 [Rhodocyclaceae bacterium]|nr:hypothetical protein [Rhodocyclaceae bacterium]